MQTRPRLVTSIPFWALLVLSLASLIGGLVLVFQQIDAMQAVLNDPNATVVTVYVAQSWAIVGAVLLGAGTLGILTTLAVAAVVATRPRSDVSVETIDWTNDEESAPFAAAPTVASVATTAPAAPLVLEDADVETPSDAPAPAEAAESAVSLDKDADGNATRS